MMCTFSAWHFHLNQTIHPSKHTLIEYLIFSDFWQWHQPHSLSLYLVFFPLSYPSVSMRWMLLLLLLLVFTVCDVQIFFKAAFAIPCATTLVNVVLTNICNVVDACAARHCYCCG